MNNGQSWAQIPQELKHRPQWCYTFPQDADPLRRKAPRKAGNYLASDTNPADWMTFELACQWAAQVGGDVGFILTDNDPFTCIDLDVVDEAAQLEKGHQVDPELWTKQEDLNRFWNICQVFNSYTEYSRSGRGLHVWVYGDIGKGCKRDGVEVYSRERFIITTGNIIIAECIQPQQQLLDTLVSEIRKAQLYERRELVELDEEITDAELIDRAMGADNAEKFNALCKLTANNEATGEVGTWHGMGYKSQSEADLALMSIFTFYSRSNEQCRRLFRMAPLAQRAKSLKDNRYMDFTLGLIRGRQAQEGAANLEAIDKAAELVMFAEQELQQQQQQQAARNQAQLMHVPGTSSPQPAQQPQTAHALAVTAGAAPQPLPEHGGDSLDWPPGMAGQICQFVFRSAMRPVKEVAIVTGLGWLAGVCGKAFAIPQSGLNMYITLVARSGVGKETMHSGMAALASAAASRQPPAMRFVEFSKYASGPALTKGVAANNSFVNVVGEWGRMLKRMSNESGKDSGIQDLRTVMTDLYQKSGEGSIVGGLSYSNKDSNIASVTGVAYSMIGETTPSTFYESLTPSMMEDGFLSRFLIIEYNGIRPPLNTNPEREPSKLLGDAMAELCTHALTVLDRNVRVYVGRTNDAAILMQDFDLECDAQINQSEDESWRQMWNRASLKVMRLAALLAAADDWLSPCVQAHHVTWAMMVVRRDIKVMARRMEDGDVGLADDNNRNRKLATVIKEYISGAGAKYGIDAPESLRKAGIITRRYLQQRTSKLRQFTGHRAGASAALDISLRGLVEDGYLMEVQKTAMSNEHSYHGKAYRVIERM